MPATSLQQDSNLATVAYVQAARRIRARHAGRPGHMLRSLTDLAHQVNPHRSAPAPDASRVAKKRTESFADAVRAQLDGPTLRYSARIHVLKQAKRHGLGRFEANLIIAAVQHETRLPESRADRQEHLDWMPLLTIAVAQASILAGVWWLIAG